MTLFSSVHICIAFRLLRRGNMKLHALLGHPVSWKLFEVVSNIKKQLCIVFMYTGNLSIISTISQFESDSKMCTFECICIWCLDNWSRILSGKPFNTFSMARLKTLQFRLTRMHFCSLFHHFISWSVIGVVRVSSAVRREESRTKIGYFFYSRDPRFTSLIDSPWFVKFSEMANFNFRKSWFWFFFIFWDSWPESPPSFFSFFFSYYFLSFL